MYLIISVQFLYSWENESKNSVPVNESTHDPQIDNYLSAILYKFLPLKPQLTASAQDFPPHD
jgi:hypothetical protein